MLACIALSAACDGGDHVLEPADDAANTEVELLISDPETAAEELALLIDFVSYRITCLDSGVTPMYDDSVDITGIFESNVTANPAVWTLVTDLPLSPCTIALWVFYEDEVVCSGSEALSIVEDDNDLAPNKVNIDLECSLSVNRPSGDVDIDGSFEFIHGNYCPKLNWLGALMPVVVDPLEMTIEASGFDVDSTCGLNCDPQTCDSRRSLRFALPLPIQASLRRSSRRQGMGALLLPLRWGRRCRAELQSMLNPSTPATRSSQVQRRSAS